MLQTRGEAEKNSTYSIAVRNHCAIKKKKKKKKIIRKVARDKSSIA